MPGSPAIQHPCGTARLEWVNLRALLAALLLVLLTGLPQIGIGLTASDFAGERMTGLPVTRSVLIDKLLPEAASLVPPHLAEFPPSLVQPSQPDFRSFDRTVVERDEPEPNPWWLDLTQRLYRHHSSYV
ncbi:MAG TPA: hypothetical protein VF168_06615 [Trueperaceae bacterium]